MAVKVLAEKRPLDNIEQMMNNALAMALNSKSSKCVQMVLDATTMHKYQLDCIDLSSSSQNGPHGYQSSVGCAPSYGSPACGCLGAPSTPSQTSYGSPAAQVSWGSFHAITDMMPSLAVRYPFMCYRFLADLDLMPLGEWMASVNRLLRSTAAAWSALGAGTAAASAWKSSLDIASESGSAAGRMEGGLPGLRQL
eukprot:1160142-Pelagomonas_calceolata.AAC.29